MGSHVLYQQKLALRVLLLVWSGCVAYYVTKTQHGEGMIICQTVAKEGRDRGVYSYEGRKERRKKKKERRKK